MRTWSLASLVLLVMGAFAAPALAQGTVVDLTANDPELRTFYRAIQLADIEVQEMLGQSGSYTVLAPTNAAFLRVADFLDLSLDELLEDDEVVTQIVRYHTLPGALFTPQLTQSSGQVIPTMLPGAFIGVGTREGGELVFNSAGDIERGDINASNGVIHVIDDVLLNRVINETIASRSTDGSTPTPEPTPEADPETAEITPVRLLNLLGDLPEVAIFSDGTLIVESLGYGMASPVLALPAGTVQLTLRPPFSDTDTAALTLDLPADTPVTIALAGSSDDVTSFPIEDRSRDVPDGMVRLVLLHAAQNGEQVAVRTDEALLSRLDFGEIITFDIPRSEFDYALTLTPVDSDAALEIQPQMTDNGSYFLIAVTGEAGALELIFFGAMQPDNIEPAVEAADDSLLHRIETDARFSVMLQVLSRADASLSEMLGQGGSNDTYTVFAPTNQAFTNLLATLDMSLDELMLQPDILTSILRYHIVPDVYAASDISAQVGVPLFTLNTSSSIRIFVTEGGTIRLNDVVTIVDSNLPSSNGLLHVVDNVLLPADVLNTLGLDGS